ncbi:TraB/GumN family protein [uncultured Maribacter sp.]|uniref:TraB/GumN family protein n=1 Tax=uncultured Maribacter sp. TaxID=431308 RepID=UPI002623FF26|nr:TraB/GumN family protein [uncultured Maribacter sp.]
MRLKITFTFLLACLGLYGQEKNSLLWEISGNGLKQSSYLYGTMHVSKKIAFRLDDVFYEALDKSDIIALESDPNTWLDSDDIGGSMQRHGNGLLTKGFYTYPFVVNNPRKEIIASYLASEDRIVNNILFRTNEHSQNFEEETYLDMFIYQSAKKFDKKVVALEDMEEAATLVGRASLNPVKQKPDEWLQKKMQLQDPMFMLQDAYRERNINLLDSIDRAMYTTYYIENMLHIRNRNMTKSLDSVMQLGKVFAGIGAAHLPGKNGVIDLLQKKGYTVKALTSRAGKKGQQIKSKLERKIKINTLQNHEVEDRFFSILLPNKIYPITSFNKTTYVSPDLANGSFVVINRIPTHSFLKQKDLYSIQDIDQLLFENIPGKITEKTEIQRNGFKGLNIRNELKNGDQQRYHIYKTPLEIIIFKMGGEGNFVTQFSDTIFNSISFKKLDSKKLKLNSTFKDFEITMPSLHNFTNSSRAGNRFVEGYDSITDSYYFLKKASLNDFNFIEQDSFELKQIQKRFYQDLKLNPEYEDFNGRSLTSKAPFNNGEQKFLHLKTTFNNGNYYLLGVLTKNEEEAIAYLSSLKLMTTTYQKPFKTVIDTAMFFSTKTTVKPPKFVESSNANYYNEKKNKPYDAFHKKTIYSNKNQESIWVQLNKSQDLLMFKNIDSVWALRKRLYAKQTFGLKNISQKKYKEGIYELQLTLTDTASTRGILIKNIVKDGLLWELKTPIDTVVRPSKFVENFYRHFKPMDTVIGKDILQDKTNAFFTALRQNDSLVIDGYRYVKFDKKNVDSLKFYIAKHKFTKQQKNIQSHLIQELGEIKGVNLAPFFKTFYANSYSNSNAQAKVLKTIANRKDEASIDLLLYLMSTDLPLVSNNYQINSIFKPYSDSLALGKKLFPEILEYSAIEEYKSPIFSILSRLKGKGYVKTKVYKKYKKQILNDAKILLKRQLGVDSDLKTQNRFSNHNSGQIRTSNILEDYVILLFPFRKEKTVQQFFTQLQMVKNPEIRTTHIALLAENNEIIPTGILKELAKNIESRAKLFKKLKAINKLQFFPSMYKTQQHLAETLLYTNTDYVNDKALLKYICQEQLQYQGKAMTAYYFKKGGNHDYDKNYKMHMLVFENKKGLQTEPFYKNNAMRIEDTDTDEETINYVREQFLLKNHNRAIIYRPNGYGF